MEIKKMSNGELLSRLEQWEKRDEVWRNKKEFLENGLAKAWQEIGELINKIAEKDVRITELESYYKKTHSVGYISGIVKPYEETIDNLKCCNQEMKSCLESIAANACCDKCQEAARWAKEVLEKIKCR